MKSIFSIVFVFVSLTFSVFSQNKGLKINDEAPLSDQKMKSVNGEEISVKDLNKENGVLVIFSCNTCPFVVGMKDGSFPGWERQYNDIQKLAKEKGFGIILVNSNEAKRPDEDSFEEMQKRAKEKAYEIPYVVDEKSVLADAYGAKTTPHVYLFNKDLKLIYTGSIDNSWDPKRKEDVPYLTNALNEFGGKIKVTESEPRGCSIKRVVNK